MQLSTASYAEQKTNWPASGRHILAQYDDSTIIVYQAYRPQIGCFAIEHGRFGDGFKFNRMSWIKPNFLWMMFRSDWGRSEGQEVVLALRLRRAFFDRILSLAVPSSYNERTYQDRDQWQTALRQSKVRLQWDPDHLPTGHPCERRAIQLGLRGQTLQDYATKEIVEVIDVSPFVAEQRANALHWKNSQLATPIERSYRPADVDVAIRIGLDGITLTGGECGREGMEAAGELPSPHPSV